MTKPDGGWAFPRPSYDALNQPDFGTLGMTLRDWFAGQALMGYRAAGHVTGGAFPSESKLRSPDEIARWAYRDADAMLAERDKGDTEEPTP